MFRRPSLRPLPLVVALALALDLHAQVVTDGSLGAATSLAGEMTIPESLGTRHGTNLFHSFAQFDIQANESATFTGSSDIQHVVGRVTGGMVSHIDGTLRSAVGSADLTLINPAGVVLGAGAVLDVPAALHLGTAHAVRLADGSLFSALDPAHDATLTTAPPAAFGFLDAPSGRLVLEGAQLSVAEGATLQLAGAAVALEGTTLSAPGGRIDLSAVAGPGTVALDGDPDAAAPPARGDLTLVQSQLVVDGPGGGRITLQGGDVHLTDSHLSARSQGAADGAGIRVDAQGELALVRGLIDTRGEAAGNAGAIELHAASLLIDARDAVGESGLYADALGHTEGYTLAVGLDLAHTWGSDVSAVLIAPDGSTLTLFDALSGGFVEASGLWLLDQAQLSIDATDAPYSGEFRPSEALALFDGLQSAGVWRLEVSDGYMQDEGVLTGFRLAVRDGASTLIEVDAGALDLGIFDNSTLTTELTLPDPGWTLGAPPGYRAGAITLDATGALTLLGAPALSNHDQQGNPPPVLSVGALAVDGVPSRYHYAAGELLFAPSHIALDSPDGTPHWLTHYTLDPTLGTQVGENLFYSFHTLDLEAGETLTFDVGEGVAHLVNRVTGGAPTRLDGTLAVTGEAAFYLFNPQGVTLAFNAQLDLPAGVHLATADGVRLADGTRYDLSATPVTTTAAPTAFIFDAGGGDGALTISGELNEAPLPDIGGWDDIPLVGLEIICDPFACPIDIGTDVGPLFRAHDLYLHGGITLAGRSLTSEGVHIETPGSLSLSALGGLAAEVPFAPGGAQQPDPVALLGAATLADAGQLTLGSGSVFGSSALRLTAGDATLSGSDLNESGAGALLQVGNRLTLEGRAVLSEADDWDPVGLDIAAAEVHLYDQSRMQTYGGDIHLVTSGELELADGALLRSRSGGTLTIEVGSAWFHDAYWNTSTRQRSDVGVGTVGDIDYAAGLYSIAGCLTCYGSTQDAGTIHLDVSGALILDYGEISTRSIVAGAPGELLLNAAALTMSHSRIDSINGSLRHYATAEDADLDGRPVRVTVSGELTLDEASAITTRTTAYSDGGSGDLHIRAAALTLANGASITSDTLGAFDAGELHLVIDHDVTLSGASRLSSSSDSQGGDAGSILLIGHALWLSGTATGLFTETSGLGPEGRGGNIVVQTVGGVTLLDGALISAESHSNGNAGSIRIEAHSLLADGLSTDSRTGLYSSAHASHYTVWLDENGEPTEHNVALSSIEATIPGGAAGLVSVNVSGDLTLRGGAQIASATYGAGDGGEVRVVADHVYIDGGDGPLISGLYTLAESNSWSATLDTFRQPGAIRLSAQQLHMRQGALLSAENRIGIARPEAVVAPTIRITANSATLRGGSRITTQSEGQAQAAAIELYLVDALAMYQAAITTEAEDGDGGAIVIDPALVRLTDSRITTSVNGNLGNGGDITLRAGHLLLDGGFIQANTAATGASGGGISLTTQTLIPFGGWIDVANPLRQPFTPGTNVIQAAAPSGINGLITITAPDLDLAGELADLETPYLDPARLFTGGCAGRAGGQSRIAWGGRGILPWSSGAPMLTMPKGGELEAVTQRATGCWIVGSGYGVESDR